MSSECHVVVYQWCRGFGMIFTSRLNGYKRKMHERVGIPSCKFRVHWTKLTSPPKEYFYLSWQQVSQEFLHSSEIMCLVLCCITVMCFYFTRHQFSSIFITQVTAKLASPATETGIPDYKDLLPFWCWWKLAKTDQIAFSPLIFPLCGESFVVSLSGLKKRASKSKWHFNCLSVDSLYRCNGLELGLRLTGMLYSYPALSCCHGKHLLGALNLPWGNSVYDLKG